ncbi:hypothetical protein IFM89_004769 [Coptis chinensis]|uniref:Inhibitor I9 domain-containing protein n=1 Tax=Coptis chinensis TaxID=261450 RepID=A0A835LPK7_9MAGN|nr:hypothetical protein IFM89_004769 [Coptis chinensis]
MEEQSRGMCPTDGSRTAFALLSAVKKKRKDAIIYSYKVAASGFSAKLTPEQVSQISIYMLKEQDVYAAEMEHTFIAIKPDGVQRGLHPYVYGLFLTTHSYLPVCPTNRLPHNESARKGSGGSTEGSAPFLQLPHFSEVILKKIARKVTEEIRLGLELNDIIVFNKGALHISFLGELYNYEHIDSSVIFKTLYLILAFGHGTSEV